MNLLTLINEEGVILNSGKRVFNADETGALQSTVATAAQLAKTLAKKNKQIEEAVVAGREAGYEEGRAAGLEEARNTLASQLIELNKLAKEFSAEQRTDTVQLALEIVRKITTELAPENTLLSLAKSAARECIDDPSLMLKVHPDRFAAVQKAVNEHTVEQDDVPPFAEVVADASLELDGCVLDSKFGAIVADLDTQLKAIKNSLVPEA